MQPALSLKGTPRLAVNRLLEGCERSMGSLLVSHASEEDGVAASSYPRFYAFALHSDKVLYARALRRGDRLLMQAADYRIRLVPTLVCAMQLNGVLVGALHNA